MRTIFIFPVTIGDKIREENFEICLKYYSTYIKQANDEILVVEQNNNEPTKIKNLFGAKHILFQNTCFNLSKGRNVGLEYARQNGFDIAAIVDMDCIVPKKAIETLKRGLSKENPWGYPFYKGLYDVQRHPSLLESIKNGVLSPRHMDVKYPLNCVSVSLFYMILLTETTSADIFDERYEGWGPEDLDFFFTMEKKYGPPVRVEAPCFHLSHSRGGRFYEKDKVIASREYFKSKFGDLEYVLERRASARLIK